MTNPAQQDQLERATDAFDALTDERGWGEPPLLLRVERGLDPGSGGALGVKRLDDHPAQALLGFSAPLAWTAMGVSAEGWATSCRPVDHGYRIDPVAGSSRERVRSLVLVSRDGLAAGRLRWPDGRVDGKAPAEGLVMDCLRRALGRRTVPPAAPTARLFATLWLQNILALARRTHRQVSWPRAVTLHPAVQVLSRGGEAVQPDDLVEVANTLSRACDWAMVRHQIIAGWRPVDIDPRVAVWMDTGMLSRWLLDRRAGVDELLDALATACPPEVLQRIRRGLDGMGVMAREPRPDVA